jgi:hypothetical protein
VCCQVRLVIDEGSGARLAHFRNIADSGFEPRLLRHKPTPTGTRPLPGRAVREKGGFLDGQFRRALTLMQ